jgi:hypothetical protein
LNARACLLLIVVAVSLQCCTSIRYYVRPYIHEANKNDGEIVVFCQSSDFLLGKIDKKLRTRWMISLDGQNVIELGYDEYVSFKVGAGNHRLGRALPSGKPLIGERGVASARFIFGVSDQTQSCYVPTFKTKYFKIKQNPAFWWKFLANLPFCLTPIVGNLEMEARMASTPEVLIAEVTHEDFYRAIGKMKERAACFDAYETKSAFSCILGKIKARSAD